MMMELILISLIFILLPYQATSVVVDINTQSVHSHVHPQFLSITLDTSILKSWNHINFSSPRTETLLRGLSPCYLRLGGTSADFVVYTDKPKKIFGDIKVQPSLLQLTSSDIDQIVKLLRKVDIEFILDLNLQLRYGSQWDPTNAIQLLTYIQSKGYKDVFNFELGNEPDLFSQTYQTLLNGTRVGKDFRLLHQLLTEFNFTKSVFVGPDTAQTLEAKQLMYDFIEEAGDLLTAATIHHYYFNGITASVNNYIDPKYFDKFNLTLQTYKDIISKTKTPNLPLWVGETSDGYNSGTKNVSDRFVSGFLWLDKLGVAASEGIGVVIRQAFYGENYALADLNTNTPNPDYWLSYIHKQLVGQAVFNVFLNQGNVAISSLRVYCHCTKKSSKYPAGAVTVFALNVATNQSQTLMFTSSLSDQPVDVYMLAPFGNGGLTSREVSLNGKLLEIVDDTKLPDLNPKTKSSKTGIKLQPLTFGFFVFSKANVKACL